MGVKLDNIAKDFGNVRVIKDISMDIPTGSFAVFVGPSGCGKSTLLRMIAGLEESSTGVIEIDQRDVTQAEPADRGVAMVFQSYALYPHLSVFENMAFSLRLARKPKAQVREKVHEAARILQLEEHLDKKPAKLSGGQRQRVAIGRAIVRNPSVFLFDEPLSNLDAELRVQMRLELTRLHRQLGATMIYVTHDQVEAMTLADKIFVLKDGIVQQAGAPLELYDNPDNQFIAGFIGSPAMTFVPCTVVQCNGRQMTLRTQGSESYEFKAVATQQIPEGSHVSMGVRPEHWRIADNGLAVRVEVAEELGGMSYLHTRTEDNTEIVVQRQGTRDRLDGSMIHINAPPENILIFDTAGQRIR